MSTLSIAPASPQFAPWPRRIAVAALVLVLLLFAVWALLFITKGRFLRPWFETIASARAQRQVKVAGEFNLYFDPIDLAFRADGLTVANPAWAQQGDLIAARHLALRVRTGSLLWGRPVIAQAAIDGARLGLQWDAQHQRNTWTFATSGLPATTADLPDIERGVITQTHVDYGDPQAQLVLHVDVSPIVDARAQAGQAKFGQALGFTGTGTLRNQPVRFAGQIEQPDRTVDTRPSAVVLHAQANATTIDVSGQMPGITNIAAGQYHFAARGANMANLFDFMGVVAVPTRRYHLVADVVHTDQTWTFSGIKGTFGDSDLAGRLAVATRGDRLHLDADLHTASLDLLDAAPILGYDPQRLDQMGTRGLVTRENGHPRILPDAPLRSADLRRFDADLRYRVGAIAASHFPVGQIDLTLRLDHGVLTLQPLTAVVAGGRLDSGFVLDTRGPEVKAQYRLALRPTPLGTLLAQFGVKQSGTTGTLEARVAMHGVGDSLRSNLGHASGRMAVIIPAGTLSTRDAQLAELDIGTFAQRMFQKKLKDPVAINCGLVAFTVADGVARADPLLIDTRKNVITGTGDFSFRDESVDLQVRARGKTFSLFSLQSPVGVGGYLAAPRVNVVSGQLLRRIAVGGALGLVASPVAALIAFVDPGNGKAAACGPVLAGARSAAQHTTTGQPVKGLSHRKP
jgi:uncharacterized protein involved in outer membrane biogenesis